MPRPNLKVLKGGRKRRYPDAPCPQCQQQPAQFRRCECGNPDCTYAGKVQFRCPDGHHYMIPEDQIVERWE